MTTTFVSLHTLSGGGSKFVQKNVYPYMKGKKMTPPNNMLPAGEKENPNAECGDKTWLIFRS